MAGGIVKKVQKAAQHQTDKAVAWTKKKAKDKAKDAVLWAVGKATKEVREEIKTRAEDFVHQKMEIYPEAELLLRNPERSKLVFCFGRSLSDGLTVRDERGDDRYFVKKRGANVRKIVVYQNGKRLGEVRRKRISLRNPFSFKQVRKRYKLIKHGRSIGVLKTYIEKKHTVGRISGIPWEISDYPLKAGYLIAEHGREVGTAMMTTAKMGENYVLDFDKAIDETLILLTFIGMRMAEEA